MIGLGVRFLLSMWLHNLGFFLRYIGLFKRLFSLWRKQDAKAWPTPSTLPPFGRYAQQDTFTFTLTDYTNSERIWHNSAARSLILP
jgi:hypothetical protein